MKVCTDSCLFGAWAAGYAMNKNRILDIGAGTGLLMLMLAQQTSSILDGIEVEPLCYLQLQSNLSESPWHSRLNALAGDVRDYSFPDQYDFIISNPPFFSSDLLSGSETNKLARHSTHLSLHELFNVVNNLLTADGNFLVIIPYRRLSELMQISQTAGFEMIEQVIVSQTDRHAPFRVFARVGRRADRGVQTSTLVIKKDGNYSPEFVDLMQGYYLHI